MSEDRRVVVVDSLLDKFASAIINENQSLAEFYRGELRRLVIDLDELLLAANGFTLRDKDEP